MNKLTSTFVTLLVLFVLFIASILLNDSLLSNMRIDLTENKVYSLSEGSSKVISEIEEPINLYFFFSDTATKGMVGLRNYADQVQSLLETYSAESQGKIRLHIIDPKPFSEDEDRAAAFGLTGAQLGMMGDAIYFGLAGTNSLDDQKVIGFFDPQQEQFLEYEISKLVYQLAEPRLPVVALVTDLPVDGMQNPMTGRFEPPLTFYTQLQQLYDVTVVSAASESLPENTDLVLMAHATNINESLRFAIDQHVMSQGKLVVFADPYYESSTMGMPGEASDLSLLNDWGIVINEKIVLDPQLGLDIRGPQGGVIRHPGILGVSAEQIDSSDIVTANMDTINVASAGHISLKENSELNLIPLMQTSSFANVINNEDMMATQNPSDLSQLISEEGSIYTLAARVSGTLTSAYADSEDTSTITASQNANILLIADADLLLDRFWVQQSNFFGQTVYSPFANNGDLVINAVDNLSGSASLISVRSRGTFSRPFNKVEELEVQAQSRFREQEERLQNQLLETEQKLAELQNQQIDATSMMISPEEQAAIDNFIEQRIQIRQALREVRFELQRDIDALGNRLKVINIAVSPLLLTFALLAVARLLRRRAVATPKAGDAQ
ncbi:ABC transporter [Alteromonas sediminis]|uniref:ABC transporter n=1 Tax=Alteromonas sediminis TaxID=2259342 RepID=A0A3N5XYW0_9ALTE|nr:Gldg family protein [Alteromonas sediminis]RPJ65643.1 ABC transporter [Alteromonas sediminis]